MAINDKFVQLQGPFTHNQELVDLIKAQFPNFQFIKRIGIQSTYSSGCFLNGQKFEIGKTEILELNEVHITSIYFETDEPASTIVDCVLE